MAEHKVSGGTMLLFIGRNEGKYDTVICLKSVSITDSVASIDISSWCGPGKLPGLNDITLSFEGFHIQDPLTDRISGTDLRQILRDQVTIIWKLSPETPIPGDEIQSGSGFISQLDSTYLFDNVGSFNFTINVKGDVTTEIINQLTLGQEYEGGTIAWIDGSGQHGLIIPIADYSTGFYQSWCETPYGATYLGITSTDYGDGLTNSNSIVSAIGYNNAAGECLNLVSGGYSDWFLPTNDELLNILNAGQIPSAFNLLDVLWTSSEYDAYYSRCLFRSVETMGYTNKINFMRYLPCRYF